MKKLVLSIVKGHYQVFLISIYGKNVNSIVVCKLAVKDLDFGEQLKGKASHLGSQIQHYYVYHMQSFCFQFRQRIDWMKMA